MKIEITDIILWILFLLSISTGLWYLFGNSPTLEQVLLIFLISSVFGIVINLTKIGVKVGYIEKNIKDSFNNMKNDINIIKKDINLINKN